MWKIPPKIVTPNLEADINRLLSTEILQLFRLCTDNGKKDRIRRITEMLDFSDHLLNFREYLISINKPTIRVENNKIFRDDHIQFNGHDFSGCEFDIEAFIYYIYVSIIDTSMAKNSNYVSIRKFLENDISEKSIAKDEVLALCDKYNEVYGLSRNFREVFETIISLELQNRFVNGILVLSDDRETDYTKAEIDTRWGKWQKTDVKIRMKKIANCLYSIRSSYTHSNIRSFIPTNDWNDITLSKNIKYLLQKDVDLLDLLKSVILELCESLLSTK